MDAPHLTFLRDNGDEKFFRTTERQVPLEVDMVCGNCYEYETEYGDPYCRMLSGWDPTRVGGAIIVQVEAHDGCSEFVERS